jgi:hypothetical protein
MPISAGESISWKRFAISVNLCEVTDNDPAKYFADRRAEQLFYAFKVPEHCAQYSL